MDKQKKKELLEQYKFRKPEMGIIAMRCTATGDLFLDISKDTVRGFNRYKVQLDTKTHPNRKLQELWNAYGEGSFECTVFRKHEYDDPADDQTAALNKLLDECLAENPSAQCIWRPKKY